MDEKTLKFIERASAVHNGKYDYKDIIYKTYGDKVEIICPIHGKFSQRASSHLKGVGCPKCSGRGLTKEERIEKFREVHGDKYDYSKIEYKTAQTLITVICPEHGEFRITPNSHLNGSGCPKCNGGVKYSKEDFIEKARKVHGDKYDYSKVEYVNAKTRICIICPEHGEFWQTPDKHLSGHGCYKCSGRELITQDVFIRRCKDKFGSDFFDYSNTIYKDSKTNVSIRCAKCGNNFEVNPINHMRRGDGCPHCGLSILEMDVSLMLKKEGIEFQMHQTFPWMNESKSHKSVDFYLPKHNIAIECQGLQHYKPVAFFGGEKRWKKQTKNDKLKFEQCKEHGVEILYYTKIKGYENLNTTFNDVDSLKQYIKEFTETTSK